MPEDSILVYLDLVSISTPQALRTLTKGRYYRICLDSLISKIAISYVHMHVVSL